MKIEFRKVPQTTKELVVEYNSVKLKVLFVEISSSLVKINAVLKVKLILIVVDVELLRFWKLMKS